MYGLLLEAIGNIMKEKYGADKWEQIRRRAGIDTTSFATHTTYREDLIPRISKAAASVLHKQTDDIMYEFGKGFVLFVSQFGYDNILKVLGRNMRDFLNGLDNLHEYLRFSYPKMNAPSFFVENETKNGLTLHYRTKREGFIHYVMGQIKQVGRLFYGTDVDIRLGEVTNHPVDSTTQITFHLLFDNSAFKDSSLPFHDNIVDTIPLRAQLLFELFPFHVVFSRDLEVRNVGSALSAVIPDAVGQNLDDIFFQARPLTKLCAEEILAHTNNVFELVTRKEMKKTRDSEDVSRKRRKTSVDSTSEFTCSDIDDGSNRLHLKGQMKFMKEWDSIMFLGTPIMQTLEDMFQAGLYINDLSMHDCSRDLVLAGTQQSAELKLALDQEQQKSRLLSESMKKLDREIKRTDEFVYQMIPKPVADRLRQGESSVNTCQTFDSVTILFSDVVGFTTICSRITPMEVVSMLNAMYTVFDQLSEKHCVYKVETIGDAYMAVAGAPTVTTDHAMSMCDMALDMLLAMPHLKDPSSSDSMKIRIGIHTGSTVAGVVGLKMPRYCLFGDTVNTASRMESTGQAMKIHISQTTREMMIGQPYHVTEREEIKIKGKGHMKTYWLLDRTGKSVQERKEERKTREKAQQAQDWTQQAMDTDHQTDTNSLPAHRHIYSPVSFDDLTYDLVHRYSPGSTPPGRGTPNTSRDTPNKGTPNRDTPRKSTPRKDTPSDGTTYKNTPSCDTPNKSTPTGGTPVPLSCQVEGDSTSEHVGQALSIPCPMAMMSENRTPQPNSETVSGAGHSGTRSCLERAPAFPSHTMESAMTSHMTQSRPVTSGSTCHLLTSSKTCSAVKPTQAVPPTRSDTPSPPHPPKERPILPQGRSPLLSEGRPPHCLQGRPLTLPQGGAYSSQGRPLNDVTPHDNHTQGEGRQSHAVTAHGHQTKTEMVHPNSLTHPQTRSGPYSHSTVATTPRLNDNNNSSGGVLKSRRYLADSEEERKGGHVTDHARNDSGNSSLCGSDTCRSASINGRPDVIAHSPASSPKTPQRKDVNQDKLKSKTCTLL